MWGTEPLWQHLAALERGECQDTPELPGIPAQGVNCPSFTTVMNFREAEKFVQGHPVHPSRTRSPCPAHWQCCSRTRWAPSCQGWASWGIWCVTEGRGAHAYRASREGREGGCPWALLHPPGQQFDGQLVWELPGKLWLSSAATVPKRCHPPPLQAQCPSPACSPLSPSWGVGPARPQQGMQWLLCHLGASNITPCPSLSVCLCCCSAGLE